VSQIRILVLTSSTGAGHDARAEAFAEWCFQLYRHDVDVRIEQMLEKSSVLNRIGVNFYNYIQKRAPIVHNAFYAFVELLSLVNQRTVSRAFGRSYYVHVLSEYRPHLILSVHDCLNRGYFPLARETLGADRVKCAIYCGEFSGGWGYSRNWIEPSTDLYISRTPTARDYALKKGIPPERATVRGNLMLPQTVLEVVKDRAAFREKRLGLRPDLFTVFLATGGNGANNHFDLLPTLLRHADRCQAIVICGRNKQTYNDLVHWRDTHPEFNCFLQGYSDIVRLLMQASDAIVTRPGTTTCAEALHFGCPVVFNAFGGIMPQEELTVKFFRNGAAAEKIEDAVDFANLIDRWMQDPGAHAGLKENLLKLRFNEDPTLLIDELVALANQVAQAELHRNPFPPPA
jgi:processive 1,2-diacylglycerol beta-glucosyltransferase